MKIQQLNPTAIRLAKELARISTEGQAKLAKLEADMRAESEKVALLANSEIDRLYQEIFVAQGLDPSAKERGQWQMDTTYLEDFSLAFLRRVKEDSEANDASFAHWFAQNTSSKH